MNAIVIYTVFSISISQPPKHYITGCSSAVMECFQWGRKRV